MNNYKVRILLAATLGISAMMQAELQPMSNTDAKEIVACIAGAYKTGVIAHEAQIFFDSSYECHKKYIEAVLKSINLDTKHLEQIKYALFLLEQALAVAPQAYKEEIVFSQKYNALYQSFLKNNSSAQEIEQVTEALIEDSQFDNIKALQALTDELVSFVDPLIQEIQAFFAQFNAQELEDAQREEVVKTAENFVKAIKPSLVLLESIINEMLQVN